MCFFLVAILHVFIFILLIIVSKFNEVGRCSKLKKFIKFLISKAIHILTFGYYIRSILEFSQYLFISSMNEIYMWKSFQTSQTISLIASLILILSFLALVWLTTYLSLSSYKVIEKEHNYNSPIWMKVEINADYLFLKLINAIFL